MFVNIFLTAMLTVRAFIYLRRVTEQMCISLPNSISNSRERKLRFFPKREKKPRLSLAAFKEYCVTSSN